MTKLNTSLILAAMAPALALSACNQPQPETEPAVEAEAPAGTGAVADNPEGVQATPALADNVIPVRYQGVWDYERGSCAPESDMLMTVTAYDITYYESYGRVTGTRPQGDDLIVDLAMEGEGDQWQESQRLALVGTGTAVRMHVTNGEEPKVDDEYPRKSCS